MNDQPSVSSAISPVLILGAGINGCAIARELTLSGVPVVVVDRADVSFGTTAYSSRLIHGGLRYLEHGEFDLVREALEERTRLLKYAPHLVEPLRLFIPVGHRLGGIWRGARGFFNIKWGSSLSPSRPRGLWAIRTGLWLYDRFSRGSSLPKRSVHRLTDDNAPKINSKFFRWIASYWDAQVKYPERLCIAMLKDARSLANEQKVDFRFLPYHVARLTDGQVEVIPSKTISSSEDPSEPSTEINSTVTFTPSAIINATGVWVDETLSALKISSKRLMGGTKGSHFITRSKRLIEAMRGSSIYAEADDGRPVFILTFGKDAVLVGTTDERYQGDPKDAVATKEELGYLVNLVNKVFPSVDLQNDDVESHCCGVRPLPYRPEGSTAAITRRHWMEENTESSVPLWSVIGGKLTTCRSLAEEAAHVVLDRLGLNQKINSRQRFYPGGSLKELDKSAITSRPAVQTTDLAQTDGFDNYNEYQQAENLAIEQLAAQSPFSEPQVAAMWNICGAETAQYIAEIGDVKLTSLDASLLTCEFIRLLIREEWVTTLGDLVERRTMLLYHDRLSRRCLEQLADEMIHADKLSLSEKTAEIERVIKRLNLHFGKQIN